MQTQTIDNQEPPHWGAFVRKSRIITTRVAGVAGFCLAALSRHQQPEDSFGDYVFELAGLAMVLACVIGRSWCTLYIAGRKTKELVTDGPYSLCRNPLYFFSFLGVLGIAAATETFTLMALVVMLFAFYYPTVIREEELKLQQIHGASFEAYCRQVPSFFPRLKALPSFQETDALTVNPRLFRKHLFSVVWFVVVFLAVHSVEWLHEIKALPVYFTLF